MLVLYKLLNKLEERFDSCAELIRMIDLDFDMHEVHVDRIGLLLYVVRMHVR